jgi:hypothetical protein
VKPLGNVPLVDRVNPLPPLLLWGLQCRVASSAVVAEFMVRIRGLANSFGVFSVVWQGSRLMAGFTVSASSAVGD